MNANRMELRAKAFDYLFDAVVVTNNEGIITDWNKGSEKLYGYTENEAIGQAVSILHVPEDVDHITASVLSAVEEFGKWTGEVRMLRKDGTIGWIESSCIPIIDNNGQMTGALGINRDITDRINETERLRHLAQYDHLTNIPNRHFLFERMSHLIDTCERSGSRFTILYFDLDKFKHINDSKGHAYGDKVLQIVAARLAETIRKSDTIARIGGDEFVLLLENTHSKKDITTVIESLTSTLDEALIIDSETLTLSCSIGVAIYPKNGITTDKLLSVADTAMYDAKKLGKAFIEFD